MSTDFYSLAITEVLALTRESVAIGFAVPEHLNAIFAFTQGQHLTLKAFVDGTEVRRSYSICGNAENQQLQIAVKRIAGGLFSNYLNEQAKVGMNIDVMAPQGHFYTELHKNNHKHYLCLAAGSGITPILSQICSILSIEPDSTVTLIYSNKSTRLMMFRNQLSFIKNDYMTRFQWINFFTQEQQDTQLFNGRISANKLAELGNTPIVNFSCFDEAFICGPESMINDVTPYLRSEGLSTQNIHYELFHIESSEKKSKEKQQQRRSIYGDQVSKVTLKLSGRKTHFDLDMGGNNILEAALYEGVDLPFSCKAGVCATCKAKLIKGKVEMDQNHSLTDEEIAEGVILTCQSHPTTAEVDIDFDLV